MEPADVVDCRTKVKALEDISKRVETNNFFRAFGDDRTEGLQSGERAVVL